MQDKKSILDNLRQTKDDLKKCTSKKEDFKLPQKIEGKLHLDSLEEDKMGKTR